MIRSQIFRISYVKLTSLRRSCSDTTKVINETLNETTAEKKDSKHSEDPFELPPTPENCCMSGCANCVWIQYAKELTDLYQDSGGTAKKIILEKIKDPSMQVFIKMELSSLKR